MNERGDRQQGFLLIISGPSGVGKSTITNEVLAELGAHLSISMTTRPLGRDDVDGEHYHFVEEASFREQIERGGLLEWAEVYGNLYGTPREFVDRELAAGNIVILEIDLAGARRVKQAMPGSYAIFIGAPNEDALLHRLRTRKREDEPTIQRRFSRAKDEIEEAHACGIYDAFIVNDHLDTAVNEAVRLVRQELARRDILCRGDARPCAGTDH